MREKGRREERRDGEDGEKEREVRGEGWREG